ncbi:MAG: NAD(P)/FAD-dependent oxidoreductase [Cytophagales bacterium]|nr:NAD(P)/FAD-dependent oxidoreductase [Cytophagales bacterium]
MERYDVCIIGAGPSGYAAAMRALDFGKKVLLIEKEKVGGAGLYNGALSSKTLWELSKDVSHARQRIKKYSSNSSFDLDYQNIKKELASAVSERKYQLESHLEGLKEGGYGDLFFFKKGTAKLVTKHQIEITNSDGTEVIESENIIIATGSTPRKIPSIPIDEKVIVTSDSVHHFDELPKSMVILGAGVIGCEYATIFSNFGQTKVHIIDKSNHILPFEDEDVSHVIEKNFEEENGILIHRNSRLERMEIKDGQVEYELSYQDGSTEIFHVEKALIAIGRVPNTRGLGLEEVGCEFNERGILVADDTQTTVDNIYAIGDVTADIALVNVGELEGRHAIKKMFGMATERLSYDNISSIMFLKPLVASVGMNEKQCREKGICYRVVSIDYAAIPRAIAMRNPPGFFKIIVTNDDEMKVLGMRALGVHASSAIQAVALLISTGQGIEELSELIHPHPSLIEGIQECVRMLLGKSIFKPHVFKKVMKYKGYMNDGEYLDLYQVVDKC